MQYYEFIRFSLESQWQLTGEKDVYQIFSLCLVAALLSVLTSYYVNNEQVIDVLLLKGTHKSSMVVPIVYAVSLAVLCKFVHIQILKKGEDLGHKKNK